MGEGRLKFTLWLEHYSHPARHSCCRGIRCLGLAKLHFHSIESTVRVIVYIEAHMTFRDEELLILMRTHANQEAIHVRALSR